MSGFALFKTYICTRRRACAELWKSAKLMVADEHSGHEPISKGLREGWETGEQEAILGTMIRAGFPRFPQTRQLPQARGCRGRQPPALMPLMP